VISHFFIDRPIFAAVISIVMTLGGTIALTTLPIAQYPPIAPPTVQVSCVYPGASARVVADTIAAPIEQQVNGVEGMLYMSSQCSNDGSYNLTITFDLGSDLNTALVMVQNRVALAMPQLPSSVQKQGLTIKKKSPNILLVINFFSPKGEHNDIYLSNFATINIKDEILRLPGVGDVTYMGQRDYSIRAWLDPQQLASRNITASEVADAIASQSIAVSSGQVGQQPSATTAEFQLPIDTLGRLTQPSQFGEIVVKASPSSSSNPAPQLVRLREVAQVELGASNYNLDCRVDGMPSVGLAVYQLPGTNALDVADSVRKKMTDLQIRFPSDVEYGIYYDTTPFIGESIKDVVKTLFEAVLLVGLVVLAFLQSWRATLIPLIAVPVAIVGTFAVMATLGFSLNNISLFGLVLAIGIVVDDAIVVVENVERWLEQGLPSREAARRAMDEVTGPVIAVALVLCAVFMPCAFIKGIPGEFFRQFAVTISVSTVFSALNSLTLSPALASILLKPHGAPPDLLTRILNGALGSFFELFNSAFRIGTDIYGRFVGGLLRLCLVALLIYGGLLGVTGWLFARYPVGFIPQQDQGWLLVNAQLPDSSSVQRTAEVMAQIEKLVRRNHGVAHTMSVSGMSILMGANSSNFGSMFIILKPFDERRKPNLSANAIMADLRKETARAITNATVGIFGAPPVPGIGLASGFKLMVEDRGSLGLSALDQATSNLVEAAAKIPHMIIAPTTFRAHTPQLKMDVDRAKAESLGVSVNDINQTLQIFLGSYYVNNFNEFGRYWQVNIQAAGKFRNTLEGLRQLYLRNKSGDMVPLETLVQVHDVGGPVMVTRYNLYSAAPVMGGAMPPVSSGQAIALMDRQAAETLPRSMKTEWTELTFMQIRAGNTAIFVFGAAVVFVFLVLAAQYESWTLPLAVILVVPMCLLCSLAGIFLRRLPMDIFVQIGFVVLVGLACKNAILIVEFAKQLRTEGKQLFEATTDACRLRLRPILMTSFAFILGVVPMVIATGAGAEMRWSLGTAVFSGMLGVTLFGVLLTPVFFYVIEWLGETSLLQNVAVQRVGSTLIGGLAGLAAGFLVSKTGFPPLHWALAIGFLLGIVAAALVQSNLRSKRNQRSEPAEPVAESMRKPADEAGGGVQA
jgi:hydrophobe/amphiphile efflux-1 (HAE1) family protein